MAQASLQYTYAAPKARVFSLFADIENVHEISPGVQSSRRLNQNKGVGALRESIFTDKAGANEQVSAFHADQQIQFTWVKMWGVPVKSMVVTFDFSEDDGFTTVDCQMVFEAKNRLLAPFVAMMNKRAVGAMLQGVDAAL